VSVTKTYQNILSIDGSTPVCTVALRVGELDFDRKEIGMGIHSSAIFSQINDLLAEAGIKFNDINAIVSGIGPGSYTGLRVVASSIKGMLFDNSIPLFGINSLAGFAACTDNDSSHKIHSIIDARRNHLFYQSFSFVENGTLVSAANPILIEIPELYQKLDPGDAIIGTGIERLDSGQLTEIKIIETDKISATGLIQIFAGSLTSEFNWVEPLDAAEFEPKYAIEDFN